jgi:hypothetical protein
MEREFSRQILEKFSNIKLYENSPNGSRIVPCGQIDRQTDGQTDITKLAVALRNFANAPHIASIIWAGCTVCSLSELWKARRVISRSRPTGTVTYEYENSRSVHRSFQCSHSEYWEQGQRSVWSYTHISIQPIPMCEQRTKPKDISVWHKFLRFIKNTQNLTAGMVRFVLIQPP